MVASQPLCANAMGLLLPLLPAAVPVCCQDLLHSLPQPSGAGFESAWGGESWGKERKGKSSCGSRSILLATLIQLHGLIVLTIAAALHHKTLELECVRRLQSTHLVCNQYSLFSPTTHVKM